MQREAFLVNHDKPGATDKSTTQAALSRSLLLPHLDHLSLLVHPALFRGHAINLSHSRSVPRSPP